MKRLVFLFSIVFLAASSFAVDVRPFAFTYTDSAQQNQWEALMKYKIWGTGPKTSSDPSYGFYLNNSDIHLTDESGYVGSAYGDLQFDNGNHSVGGPLAFGGSFLNGSGGNNDSLLSGPGHFGGDFDIQTTNGSYFAGNYCIDGTYSNMDVGLNAAGGAINCNADDIPEIESYLDVPYLDTSVTYSSALSSNNSNLYIDVPPESEGDSGVYDLFITSITMSNTGNLYVRMQPGGRLTRVFLNGGITLANNNQIRVMHAQSSDEWNSSTQKWTYGSSDSDTTGYIVSNADYLGNLMFFVPTALTLPAGNSTRTIQGTFIATEEITIQQGMKFAGQLISGKYVIVNSGFSADDFKYVPFDPPIVDIDPEALAKAALQEGITDPQTVTIELDRSPTTDVNFDYCFVFEGDSAKVKTDGNTLASYADVDTSSIPICGRDTASAMFSAGSTSLTEAITVTVIDDKLDENTETFTISIFELEGAIMSDGTRSGDFTLYIEDNDALLLSKDTTVTGKEDTTLVLNMFPAMKQDSSAVTTTYYIEITSLPEVGTLTYNGTAVTAGQIIKSTNLSYLKFLGEQDSSGTPYATLTYYILNADSARSTVEYTLTINMEPTNDYPVIADTTFTIAENSDLGTVLGTLVATDIDNDEDELEFYINAGNSLGWFSLSSSGVLTVAGAIDYESVTSVTLTIRVNDGQTKYNEAFATVTIYITNVNEAPTVANQTLYIPETASSGDVAGTVVATDPENDALKYYVIGGDSAMFAIGEYSAKVTLKSGSLDYETTKSYSILVQVYDGEFYDTAAVTIVVEDVEETSTVRVTTIDTDDTRWVITNDTAYINRSFATISWVLTSYTGKNTYNDTLVEDLSDGCYTYTFADDDKTINVRGSDTVTICVSTTTPEVTIEVVNTSSDSITGVTIVESGDTTANYSNQESNTVLVIVEDPVTGKVDTVTIEVTLDSVSVPSSTIKTVTSIQNAIDLDAEPDSVTKTPENGLIAVEYQLVVNGDTVTVKYYETEDGERVTSDEGDEIVYVSYTTTIDGKTVTVTYAYDLTTGEVVTDASTGEVYTVSYEYTDSNGNTVTVSYSADKNGAMITNAEGDKTYEVSYSYTNAYGNTAVSSVSIVLDTNGPVVKILSPENQTKVSSVSIEVVWTVDGVEQDTLTMQSLEEGVNTIIRTYRDKAGNESSDTVYVIMKNAKNVVIELVDAVTKIDASTVSEYYAGNEPEDDEVYAVSILNPNTGSEVEVLTGNSNSSSTGSGEEPYPGYTGAHLGPTLQIEVKMPSVNAVGGLATISDMIESDGLISLESGGGWDREKITVEEYISEYCSEEFQSKVDTSDLASTPIYTVKLKAHIWTFTSLGSFVDDYSFSLDLEDETLVNEGAVLTLYFELKPGTDGLLRNTEGRALGTGAYMFKTEIKSTAVLQCQLPDAAIGSKTVYKEEDLTMFGYKRPEGL